MPRIESWTAPRPHAAIYLSDDERNAIAEYLASKQPRKFEMGASADTGELLTWLKRLGHAASRSAGGIHSSRYVIDGKKYTLPGFLRYVSNLRAERGLEPIVRVG